MEQDAEMIRLQILGDPQLMRELDEVRQFRPFAFQILLMYVSAIDTARSGSCSSVEPPAVCSTFERSQHAQGLHRAAEASGDRTSQC